MGNVCKSEASKNEESLELHMSRSIQDLKVIPESQNDDSSIIKPDQSESSMLSLTEEEKKMQLLV